MIREYPAFVARNVSPADTAYYNRRRLHSTIGYITSEQADRIIRCPLFGRSEAFNLLLSTGDLRVTPERIREFEEAERTANLAREAAIVVYIETINPDQGTALKAHHGL
jgi:hypothetical protein